MTATIAIPAWLAKWLRRCRPTKTQKQTAGATIRNTVTANDLTSGPKINLPHKKNLCKHKPPTMPSSDICFLYSQGMQRVSIEPDDSTEETQGIHGHAGESWNLQDGPGNFLQEEKAGRSPAFQASFSRLSFAANSNLIPPTGSIQYSTPYPVL